MIGSFWYNSAKSLGTERMGTMRNRKDLTVGGKVILPSLGKDFFTSVGKQFFT